MSDLLWILLALAIVFLLVILFASSQQVRYVAAIILAGLLVALTMAARRRQATAEAGTKAQDLIDRGDNLLADADAERERIRTELQEESADAIREAFHSAFRTGRGPNPGRHS